MEDDSTSSSKDRQLPVQAIGLKEFDPYQYWMTPRDRTLMRDMRYVLRESQTQFWSRFGVGQTSGSRFERGNAIPLPILLLIRLYFLHAINDEDLQKVRSPDYESGALSGGGHADIADARQTSGRELDQAETDGL